LSSNTNPSVRPPSYALHTTTDIPSTHFITPFTSTIIPSSTYLSDPLNAYAHLGMPKQFVHLMGAPLDLTLDSRITGDKGRFARSGCHPNAVLRPVLCPNTSSDDDTDSLSFGVFAMRDLKANEEVVLGWEWDDGNAVHSLPALIEAPHVFP
jgi:SET domain-containing protein